MNYLFYLGIIAPTLITILLFVIFVYCWFLQKARKEVLTKKYDPHGKMRRLGIPMDPPPPPPYCRIEDVTSRFVDDSGNDNGAYDVSRSPSTEQENRGRPLYHTYHDSGISAGLSLSLSPSQENEPRHGLSYRTCPDSGISGFGVPGAIGSSGNLTGPPPLPPPQHQHQHPHHQACRGCHQAREQMPQMHPHHHHHHPQTQQQQQHHQLGRPHYLHQLQPQQVILHHNTIQASVHPTHGVCYGDDTTHPQSPQHYNPPPLQSSAMSSLGGRHFTTMPHIHEQPTTHLSSSSLSEQNVCYCANSAEHHQRYNPHHQCCPEEILDGYNIHEEHPLSSPPAAHPSIFRPQQNSSRALTLASSSPSSPRHESPPQVNGQNIIAINSPTSPTSPHHVGNAHTQHHQQPSNNNNASYPLQPQNVHPSSASSASSSSSSSQHQLPRHSHRDSGVMEVCQTMMSVSDRPDSQASTSSTTDSEDSGFRSSHCAAAVAAHTNSKLSKHGNPLLKPLRRPRQNAKTRTKTTRAGGEVDPSIHGATPLSTLNPQNLQCQVANSAKHHNVIQTTSLLDDANNLRGQRSPPRILQKHNALLKSVSNSIPEATTTLPNNNNSAGNYQNDSVAAACQSPGHGASHEATSNTNAKQQQQQQHGDMTEISTHLSWKYLQDLSGSSNSSHEPCTSQDGLQMGHTGGANNKAPPQFHATPEPQMEMFSYSIV